MRQHRQHTTSEQLSLSFQLFSRECMEVTNAITESFEIYYNPSKIYIELK